MCAGRPGDGASGGGDIRATVDTNIDTDVGRDSDSDRDVDVEDDGLVVNVIGADYDL